MNTHDLEKGWEERFDEKFPEGICEEMPYEENVFIDKTEEVKSFISELLERERAKNFVDGLNVAQPAHDGILMKEAAKLESQRIKKLVEENMWDESGKGKHLVDADDLLKKIDVTSGDSVDKSICTKGNGFGCSCHKCFKEIQELIDQTYDLRTSQTT